MNMTMEKDALRDGSLDAETVLSIMSTFDSVERVKVRQERAERTRRRLGILLEIERLEEQFCDNCRFDPSKSAEISKAHFTCDCEAATRVRALGKELDELTSPVKVEEKRKNARFTKEIVELAEKNGISYSTLYKRVVQYGWSHEYSATAPKGSTPRKKALWNEDKDKVVEKAFWEGKTSREMWRLHFSGEMAFKTFLDKTVELRKRLNAEKKEVTK